MKFLTTTVALLAYSFTATAHGDHSQSVLKQKPSHLRWQDWHMMEEHNIAEYDAQTFFTLHDLKGAGQWDRSDILNLYGMKHEVIIGDGSGMGENSRKVTPEVQNMVVETIFKLFDTDKNGVISRDEWVKFHTSGGELPDFGYGQGHHLDFESEYEEHHWNQYHAKDDPDTKIKHKEDIEHEMLHHKHEIEETHDRSAELKELTKNFLSKIRIENLKPKYRS
ncbi:hypothetical protein I9W82_005467 [Candida metapsilosis]|uniref:EF-hand domain-containing protein n=1 Tax=Candida metapsilosis TaxID=273372 RepID=A0A8H8DBK3_9ASCO|nr:hypothetical protein I9W82_005467 [Candida metapsilosis]